MISGTRSGEQRNATVFGRYFTAALEEEAADLNKDRRITAQEAFQYAESGIETYYSRNNEMTTENPVATGPEPLMVLALLETPTAIDPTLNHMVIQRDQLLPIWGWAAPGRTVTVNQLLKGTDMPIL